MSNENRTYLSLGIGISALVLSFLLFVTRPGEGEKPGKGDSTRHAFPYVETGYSSDENSHSVPPLPFTTVPNRFYNGKLNSASKADDFIEAYKRNIQKWAFELIPASGGQPAKNTITSSFRIDGHSLANYVKDAISYCGCKRIHLLLGEDATQEYLFISAILPGGSRANQAKHCYISSDQGVTDSVLQCSTYPVTQTVGSAFTPILSASTLLSPIQLSTIGTVDEMLSAGNAISMYIRYAGDVINNNATVKNANSFTIDASHLLFYIDVILYSYPKAQIEFFLGEDNGRLTLMLAGFSPGDNKNILIGDGAANYLFEHCCPCPTCEDIINNGNNLEHT